MMLNPTMSLPVAIILGVSFLIVGVVVLIMNIKGR
jgi:hypothetical protein